MSFNFFSFFFSVFLFESCQITQENTENIQEKRSFKIARNVLLNFENTWWSSFTCHRGWRLTDWYWQGQAPCCTPCCLDLWQRKETSVWWTLTPAHSSCSSSKYNLPHKTFFNIFLLFCLPICNEYYFYITFRSLKVFEIHKKK